MHDSHSQRIMCSWLARSVMQIVKRVTRANVLSNATQTTNASCPWWFRITSSKGALAPARISVQHYLLPQCASGWGPRTLPKSAPPTARLFGLRWTYVIFFAVAAPLTRTHSFQLLTSNYALLMTRTSCSAQDAGRSTRNAANPAACTRK